MHKKTRWVLFALLLAFATTVGPLTQEASAAESYPWVRLDNKANGGTVADTGTPDTITVSVKYCNSANFTVVDSRSLGVSEAHDFRFPGNPNMVSQIRVSTLGRNWLWIDQTELFTWAGVRIWSEGADNTVGWCISNDPSDGTNAVCDPDGSVATRTWDVFVCPPIAGHAG